MAPPRIPTLREFQSLDILKLQSRGTGVYEQELLVEGNSLLSSVFIDTIDPGASVLVEYFDTSLGQDVGEEYPLQFHPALNTAMTTNRITVTSIHNKPFVRATVTGGNAVFGIFVTVVASFASDLDAALKYHNQSVLLLRDKGIPTMVYDDVAGKFFFAKGTNGVLDVNIGAGAISLETANKTIVGQISGAIPSAVNTVLTYTVPGGKEFTWVNGVGTSDCDCLFSVEIDSVEVMKKRNHHTTPDCTLSPAALGLKLTAGQTLTVKAMNRSTYGTLSTIDVFIYGSEV